MNWVLTQQGRRFNSELQAGDTVTYTRAEASAEYSSNPDALLSIQNKKQDVQLEAVDVVDGKTVLALLVTNLGITSDYIMKQVGIYARSGKTGEEILYIVGQDRYGEMVPAYTDQIVRFKHTLQFSIDNAYNVEIAVNINDFVTKGYLQKNVEQLIEGNDFIELGDMITE